MKEYLVFFDVFGKKMKTRVKAETPEAAQEYVKKNLTIHKIYELKGHIFEKQFDRVMNKFDDLMKELGNLFKSK